jgi:hypothetical protein
MDVVFPYSEYRASVGSVGRQICLSSHAVWRFSLKRLRRATLEAGMIGPVAEARMLHWSRLNIAGEQAHPPSSKN